MYASEHQLFASLPLVYLCRASLTGKLEAALLQRAETKRCTECGGQISTQIEPGEILPDCA